jgi:hypothetical protein
MHLLDAFLRESARFNPIDARTSQVSIIALYLRLMMLVSVQRKVLRPFDLPSGAHIPVGNLIAVPQHALLRNDEIYPDANHFNPFRFIHGPEGSISNTIRTRYTDVNDAYPYWGSPRKPWQVLINAYAIGFANNFQPGEMVCFRRIEVGFDTLGDEL